MTNEDRLIWLEIDALERTSRLLDALVARFLASRTLRPEEVMALLLYQERIVGEIAACRAQLGSEARPGRPDPAGADSAIDELLAGLGVARRQAP
ncbi:hypothetical protein [Mucilaginibacter sp. L3T2-6]|uniref:hypothetical protein n=1 Tax=Mucilaginibacter sp. L3T2-6 TaxID=3062491 RepID=UPI00267544E6|nr:hypothetical protein [Mucilaginibacter sp. L3T2-6]MDO3641319.1 hypothetical protein [Mucilaginibacter sp. L3T2-6]MDV6213921.1 hypothetical protein [Mucilaginibacter sp. L3T2-6]